jgi:hypothetical protein
VPFAVAIHEKESSPVLAMVNCVWAPRQTVMETLVGWTSRVAGTGVAVGEGPGVGDITGVGVAPDGRVVGVGAPPWAAVAVAAALEIVCDDEFEFEEEELLEAAEGARMSWKPICCTRTASKAAISSANSKNRPIVRAL